MFIIKTLGKLAILSLVAIFCLNFNILSKANHLSKLIQISYAPINPETFEQAGKDSFKYLTEEDVGSLFSIDGGELTEYDFSKRATVSHYVDYGIKPTIVYKVLVTTEGGTVNLVLRVQLNVLGLGKATSVTAYKLN